MQEWSVSLLYTEIHTSTEVSRRMQAEWKVDSCAQLFLAGWQFMSLPSPMIKNLQNNLRVTSLFKKEIRARWTKDFIPCIVLDGPFCLLNHGKKTKTKTKTLGQKEKRILVNDSQSPHSPPPGPQCPLEAVMVPCSLLTTVSPRCLVSSTVPGII